MWNYMVIALVVLAIALPVVLYNMGAKQKKRYKRYLGINLVSFVSTLIFATIFIFTGMASAAAETATVAHAVSGGDLPAGMAYIAAAVSTGLGSIGAGVATGQAASAALGALSENENVMGKALIFVALAEGVAIYGLIISVMILSNVK